MLASEEGKGAARFGAMPAQDEAPHGAAPDAKEQEERGIDAGAEKKP